MWGRQGLGLRGLGAALWARAREVAGGSLLGFLALLPRGPRKVSRWRTPGRRGAITQWWPIPRWRPVTWWRSSGATRGAQEMWRWWVIRRRQHAWWRRPWHSWRGRVWPWGRHSGLREALLGSGATGGVALPAQQAHSHCKSSAKGQVNFLQNKSNNPCGTKPPPCRTTNPAERNHQAAKPPTLQTGTTNLQNHQALKNEELPERCESLDNRHEDHIPQQGLFSAKSTRIFEGPSRSPDSRTARSTETSGSPPPPGPVGSPWHHAVKNGHLPCRRSNCVDQFSRKAAGPGEWRRSMKELTANGLARTYGCSWGPGQSLRIPHGRRASHSFYSGP